MKKIILFIAMLGLFSLPVMAETTTCGVKTFNGHSYKVFTDSKNWADAEAYCESLGGHLVTITSANEMTFLKSFSNLSYSWIGLTAASGSWKWVTGETYSYTNWYSSASAYSSYRGRIYYHSSSSSYYGTWDYYAYSNTQTYICEWDSIVSGQYHSWQKQDKAIKINSTTTD